MGLPPTGGLQQSLRPCQQQRGSSKPVYLSLLKLNAILIKKKTLEGALSSAAAAGHRLCSACPLQRSKRAATATARAGTPAAEPAALAATASAAIVYPLDAPAAAEAFRRLRAQQQQKERRRQQQQQQQQRQQQQ
ncbi:hypothetical protein, conserved [Eimeria tenella]|uniref:Uncharacterized protein n=1 Tax=Eimeria tenella TaxID=5802 RepID=U6L9M4_EIMTE|nr:hypothetical protein, conserved [Eimeria tenella]CDJ45269.1 hypothetical protein, conserved [Eimeria tenella]|eukprot:XP_013236016.1 hypothetical protein, conserved [Eimeria tenella]